MKDRVSSDPPQGQQNFARMAIKNKTFGFFDQIPNENEATKTSCHPHIKLTRTKKNREQVWEFLKFNRENSYMSYLEAAAWQIASFLAPDALPPKVKAIVNNAGAYVGVSSQSVPFKSVHEDPLTLEDLKIPVFEALKVPCDEEDWEIVLDPFQEKMQELINECERIEKWVLAHPEKINGLDNHETIPYPYHHDDTQLSVLDFKRFRTVKRQAELLTGIYVRKENDAHANNLSREYNIDLDEAWWKFLCYIKDSFCGIDGEYKKPSPTAFNYTPEDVTTLPNTKTFDPHHLCTKKAKITDSKNAFTVEQNKVYAQLEHHPVFIYYKCVYLLNFVLLTPALIRSLLALHIPDDDIFKEENFLAHDWSRAKRYANQNVLDTFTKIIADSVLEMKVVLEKTPQFNQFLITCGKTEMKKILHRLRKHNETYLQKLKKLNPTSPPTTTYFSNIVEGGLSFFGSMLNGWNPINNTKQDLAERSEKKKEAYTRLLIDLDTPQDTFNMLSKGLISELTFDYNNLQILEEYNGQQKEQQSQPTSFRPK